MVLTMLLCFFFLSFFRVFDCYWVNFGGGDMMSRPNTRNKNKRQRPSDAVDSSSQILRYNCKTHLLEH